LSPQISGARGFDYVHDNAQQSGTATVLVHYRHPSLFGFAAVFFHFADELGH
jgi:hypothetical protein